MYGEVKKTLYIADKAWYTQNKPVDCATPSKVF